MCPYCQIWSKHEIKIILKQIPLESLKLVIEQKIFTQIIVYCIEHSFQSARQGSCAKLKIKNQYLNNSTGIDSKLQHWLTS